MKNPRKRTSSRVSSMASNTLAQVSDAKPSDHRPVKVSVIRTLCTSLLSQDEVKGQARKR